MKSYIIKFILVLMLISSLSCNRHSQIKNIALQPIGDLDPSLLSSISTTIKSNLGLAVTILPKISPPKECFINVKSPRYRADLLLKALDKINEDRYELIMGITNYDISFTKYTYLGTIKKPESKYKDFGIFGLAEVNGKNSIISTYRLMPKDGNKQQFKARILKVCIHELGHNYGKPHCSNTSCVLRDIEENINNLDQAESKLCKACMEACR